MFIKEKEIVLFQGDSITDAGRVRRKYSDLGKGYALMATGWFQVLHPEKKVIFINRGISGDKVEKLQKRWKKDCLDIKPTTVSILIGINEVWGTIDGTNPTTTEKYETGYREILNQLKEKLNPKIIILEPFVLPFPEDKKQWRKELDPKIEVVHKLAKEYEAVLIPLDELFRKACKKREPKFWAEDGVHPSPAGHALIARAWLKAVGAI